jgi:flavodoxin I
MAVHIIYGSDSGRTRAAAGKIAAKLDAKVINVRTAAIADFEGCDLLVLGSPTYSEGELQTDWDKGIDVLRQADLTGKRVALFGLGDQSTYPDSFAGALGLLHDAVLEKGAEMVGFTDTEGYEFEASNAVRDGRFVGLVLDQDNQGAKSDKRIAAWTSQIL